jgi:hypothetical protein
LKARSAIELEPDKADARIRPLRPIKKAFPRQEAIREAKRTSETAVKKITRRYVLTSGQPRNKSITLRNARESPEIPPEKPSDSVNRKGGGAKPNAFKEKVITGLSWIQRKPLELILVRWEVLVQKARIMDGGFCGSTAGECRSGTGGGIGEPARFRDRGGSAAEFVSFHKQDDYLKVVRANPERSRFPVREEG